MNYKIVLLHCVAPSGVQRETLIRQLDTNVEEIESTVQELDMHEESEEQNYELCVVFLF